MSDPAGSQMSEEPVPWYHCGTQFGGRAFKVEKILKGSLDLIPWPSLSAEIQIMGGRFKGKT